MLVKEDTSPLQLFLMRKTRSKRVLMNNLSIFSMKLNNKTSSICCL